MTDTTNYCILCEDMGRKLQAAEQTIASLQNEILDERSFIEDWRNQLFEVRAIAKRLQRELDYCHHILTTATDMKTPAMVAYVFDIPKQRTAA